MSPFGSFVASALALGVTALRFEEIAPRNIDRAPNCDPGDFQNEVLSTTDIFMRSYHGDLEWLDFSVPSITESMQCSLGVIRNVLVVVPEEDVSAFNEKLDAVWQKEQFPEPLRQRWQVMPSKLKVVGDGYQKQMLDKLHADLYSDAKHFLFLDTDTVLVRDLTREQLFNDVGQPYLCHRSVAKCGKDCEMWMQEHVKPMLGEGEMLEHEFMCLGRGLPTLSVCAHSLCGRGAQGGRVVQLHFECQSQRSLAMGRTWWRGRFHRVQRDGRRDVAGFSRTAALARHRHEGLGHDGSSPADVVVGGGRGEA